MDANGQPLSAAEREKLLKPYLPSTPKKRSPQPSPNRRAIPKYQHKQRVRPAIRHLLHVLLFTIIHTCFSVYIRVRKAYHTIADRLLGVLYYHHRTPELIQKDVKRLSKVPKHLSVILELPAGGGKRDGLDGLMSDACEIAAWSASAGVPMLSIYERTGEHRVSETNSLHRASSLTLFTGILKSSLPHLHRRIERTLTAYYGQASANKPTVSLRAPNLPSYSPPYSPEPATNGSNGTHVTPRPHLTVLLIDASDGRQTLVDLTKTLAEMSQHNKLQPADISQELIDAEITESVMGEPDLLVLFGDRVVLNGYPPWQIRLTEIYYAQDNVGGMSYHVFLRALYKYAKAEMRFGR